jgi:hypothetical protein
MKKKEIEKLLRLTDQKVSSQPDFSGFSDPNEARENYSRLILIRKGYSVFERDFSPFFVERVLGRINNLSKGTGIQEYLSMQFNRVMAYGFAAVLIVFLTLYILHGQEGFGTVLRSDSSNDINFISYLFYEL